MEARNPHRKTYADFEQLPEDARVELIDGAFYDLAAPSMSHITLQGEIFWRIRSYLSGKRCRVYQEPALRFEESESAEHAIRPDIVVLCEPEKYRKSGIVGAPSLIVEVISPSTSFNDRMKKFLLFQRYGVPEYWMVEQAKQEIHRYTIIDGKYKMDSFKEGEISSTSIQGFSLNIQELYATIPFEPTEEIEPS